MKVAHHILGYNDVYHRTDVYSNIQDCDMFIDGLNAKYFGKGSPFGRAEFDKLFGHYATVSDGPTNYFGPKLIDAYPEAKVVLVKREFDAGFKSFDRIIKGIYGNKFKSLGYTNPGLMGIIQAVVNLWLPGQFRAPTATECRRNVRTVYEEHYSEIRFAIPNDHLLEYKLGQSWETLCGFLGKEVPDVPFSENQRVLDAGDTAQGRRYEGYQVILEECDHGWRLVDRSGSELILVDNWQNDQRIVG